MPESLSEDKDPLRSDPFVIESRMRDTPPIPARRRPELGPVDRPVQRGSSQIGWLLSSLAFLLLLSVFLPFVVEKLMYAVTRGRQRAEYETAGEHLKGLPLKDLSQACQLVANRVGPSLVHISVASASASTESRGDTPFDSTWRLPPTGEGSGVIVDQAGYIVTNEHVIRGALQIRAKLSDGRSVPARVIGIDRATDLAVIKVDEEGLLAAEWGDSHDLQVGALVWALGSPFGLERSVTFGILSAKHRSGIRNAMSATAFSPYQDFLQTDAAVNPGNSGGPLVDARGRVIGINTAIVGDSYQGISFAIPSSMAQPIYERIRAEGRVARGFLGVIPNDISPKQAKELGLTDTRGALVTDLGPHRSGAPSPAQLAGIEVGDVIIRWDGKPVGSRTELFSRVGMTPIGSTVDLVIIRDGHRKTIPVTVSSNDSD